MNARLTDDLGTEVLRFLACERGCETARNDVHEDRLWSESCDGVLEELGSLDALNEADIRAGVRGELEAVDSLVHAEHLRGVRAANDNLRDVQRVVRDLLYI